MIRAINVDLTEGVESDFSEVEFGVGSGGFSTSVSFNRCGSRCSFNNRCRCGSGSVGNRCRQIPSSVSRYRCGKRCGFVDNRCGFVDNRCGHRGRCGLVDNRCGQGLVGRCGLGDVLVRTGYTFISYISNETRVAIYPVNNTLDTTVG
jgi:hypothetical protein